MLFAVSRAWSPRPRPALELAWDWVGWAGEQEAAGWAWRWPAGLPVRARLHARAIGGAVWCVASSDWMDPGADGRWLHVTWLLPSRVVQAWAYY